MRRRLTVPLALAGLLFTASTASADVLIHAPDSRLTCGDPIEVGIWAQPRTTGSRTVRVRAIDRRTGEIWWRKTARATTRRWRYWYLTSGMDGECRSTTIDYRVNGVDATYRIRFVSEGA